MEHQDFPKRKRNRLTGYDYSQVGGYSVTLCVLHRRLLFGSVEQGHILLSRDGEIIHQSIEWLASQYAFLTVDEYIVMPNHVHLLLIFHEENPGGSRTAPTEKRKTLGRVIGAFKTVSTRKINERHHTLGMILWQRSFHDHIIRNHRDLEVHRRYMLDNPANWERDDEYSVLVTE